MQTDKAPVAPPATTSLRRWAAGLCAAWSSLSALGNPQGMTVAQGNVSAVQSGPRLDITASPNAVIDWQRFNIAAGETTAFHQPSAVSVVWNRIFDANPSQIWGSLNANGIVVLMNQSGFYFGPNSSVNVGGFVAATVPIAPPTATGGGLWQFQGSPPAASIVNYGALQTHAGGSLFLVSEVIENHGVISAPGGTLGLYAGKEVLITDRPDGRGLSATVQLPAGSVDNQGKLLADAGTIALRAAVVNQNGLIQADSVRAQHGVIELVASESVNLGPNSVLRANGDAVAQTSEPAVSPVSKPAGPLTTEAGPTWKSAIQQQVGKPALRSDAGNVTIKSASTFTDDPSSRIEVKGGALGGNGGSVEISAPRMAAVQSQLDGTAQPGWRGGRLLLDPYDIALTSAASGGSAPSGTVPWDSAPGSTLSLNVGAAFQGFSQILLQAAHDISLAQGTVWDLNASTGRSDPGSQLTLEAGNNIVFGNSSRIVSSAGWSVNLMAGANFSLATPAPQTGLGGIYLNGGPPSATGTKPNFNGAIETADGNVTLAAGHEVLVGGGYVRTVGGGNIVVTTGDGDVDAGTKKDTYDYSRTGYAISAQGLGGIGTAAGGNVTIHAGRDLLSLLATIGALGGGNVDLTAGRDLKGNFLLRNGTGTARAGRDVGSTATPVSLGLVSGGWNVSAADNLYLNEVYNPNGSLNPNRVVFGPRVPFQFDYAPDASVTLTAGNAVELLGQNPAHTTDNRNRPPIYAPILAITAGAGGVVLGNDVILAPSPLGSLRIRTTAGGPLSSAPGGFYQLIVSDSGNPDYRTFATDHAPTPPHLNSGDAGVSLDISGSLDNLFLRSPRQADIFVQGNALNFAFEGQNLSPNDVTHLIFGGDFSSRSDRTFVTVTGTPNLAALTDPILSANPELGSRLTYDPTTHQLGIQGLMTLADLNFLSNPVTFVLDPNTQAPKVDANGFPVPVPTQFTTDPAAIQQLYQASQDIPTSTLARAGLQIGGPGQLVVSARNLDLGISAGIRSVGPLFNPALAGISLRGADLQVNLSGDLTMGSSQIASFNGGNIDVLGAGRMDIGSQAAFTSDDTPKGIYTGHGGHVTVHAAGDVTVSGSRIASYDGGDVTVISDHGNVDAGSGANGFFSVTTSQVDPATGTVQNRSDRFFGSGIMALTRPDSGATVGDITIQAAGSISAGSGGVLQLAFNAVDQRAAKLTLTAGGDIQAGQSGVLGENVSLKAGGSIQGLAVANQNIVVEGQAVTITAVAAGTASVKGDSVSGKIAAGGDVSVSGVSVSADAISTGGKVSGDTSGAKGGAFASVAAPTAQKTSDDADQAIAGKELAKQDDAEEKKKHAEAKGPVLARSVGRVTVILPNH